MHNYIFAPTRTTWSSGSVNARIRPIPTASDDEIPASVWLDSHKPVEQMTWAPEMPIVIRDKLINDGGWINRRGVSCFNLYQPPIIEDGDPAQAARWIDHLRYLYPNDADHMMRVLLSRAPVGQSL